VTPGNPVPARRLVTGVLALFCLAAPAVAGPSSGASGPIEGAAPRCAAARDGGPETAAERESPIPSTEERLRIEERWGIEITSLRVTANGHMLDYRYRVLDADKATDLFRRQLEPYLVHQASGKVLAVPETAKLGPLRNSNIPQEGRIYWMFFGNTGKLVHPGDRVTVVIGELRIEDILVE
jgi:hypothetical protein